MLTGNADISATATYTLAVKGCSHTEHKQTLLLAPIMLLTGLLSRARSTVHRGPPQNGCGARGRRWRRASNPVAMLVSARRGAADTEPPWPRRGLIARLGRRCRRVCRDRHAARRHCPTLSHMSARRGEARSAAHDVCAAACSAYTRALPVPDHSSGACRLSSAPSPTLPAAMNKAKGAR